MLLEGLEAGGFPGCFAGPPLCGCAEVTAAPDFDCAGGADGEAELSPPGGAALGAPGSTLAVGTGTAEGVVAGTGVVGGGSGSFFASRCVMIVTGIVSVCTVAGSSRSFR